jgi:RimJ/RimL family protein N-acetyltransferase
MTTPVTTAEPGLLLHTQRLCLRQFRMQDGGLLFDLDSDPEVMRFISHCEPTPLARIENEILPRLLSYYARPTPQGCWAAQLRENDEFIGWFHLREDKIEPAEMELGFRLKRKTWGRGLATEGARALLEKGFTDWAYEKICARTLVANLASRRVMEKCGLRFEREFVYGAELIPGWTEEERRAVKYSLLRELFSANRVKHQQFGG